MNQSNKEKKHVSFASIDQYVESNIVLPIEKSTTGKDFVEWGEGNIYPSYLVALFDNVTTLNSIINGNIDFVAGDDVTILPLGERFVDGIMNTRGDTITDMVRDLAKDYNLFGGFALQVIRDFNGDIAEIYYIDMKYLRTNKNNDVFWYCEDWEKGGRRKTIRYPKFMRDLDWAKLDEDARGEHTSSILFVKNVRSHVYPRPVFSASVKSCEIERCIDEFHLNEICNGFSSSVVVNFNNGDPGDEMKAEIEEEFNEKFSGHQNAGRVVFSWNKDRLSATTIEPFKTEDFGTKYESLAQRSKQQIYASFRAQPLLFGMVSDVSTGFSTDEFEQTFKLYNRTQIRPVQRIIANAFDKIYGTRGVLTIKPFTLSGESEQEVN